MRVEPDALADRVPAAEAADVEHHLEPDLARVLHRRKRWRHASGLLGLIVRGDVALGVIIENENTLEGSQSWG